MYLTSPGHESPTLAELGRWLADEHCEFALNLDGGPSTAAAFWGDAELRAIGSGQQLPYAIRIRVRD